MADTNIKRLQEVLSSLQHVDDFRRGSLVETDFVDGSYVSLRVFKADRGPELRLSVMPNIDTLSNVQTETFPANAQGLSLAWQKYLDIVNKTNESNLLQRLQERLDGPLSLR